jgi:nucleoside-diphosphate-sugar epimerase
MPSDDPREPHDLEPEDEPGPDAPVEPERAPSRREAVRFPSLEVVSLDDDDDLDDDEGYPDEDEDEAYDDDDEGEVRTVLITGASGNIGRKLRDAWEDVYDLVAIDRRPDPDDPELVVADLSELDESWMSCFRGVDTVIHLAADPREDAPWDDLQGPNLDALANVFHAAALAGVDRLIFASSNHAMGGYRELGDMPITVDLPPRPDGAYGAAKLFGERLGRSLAHAFDVTFIALRIGWVQYGANRPETLPDDWSRSIWLSNDDLVRLFDSAVEAELGDRLFVVVNGVSNNRGTRWDLRPAVDLLGYTPADDAYAEEY